MRNTISGAAVLLAVMIGSSFSGRAQSQINIDQAVSLALQNNRGLKSKQLDVRAGQSLKKTAFELPKLDVNAQLGQYNSINQDKGFLISQTIPFPTVFGAKKQLANAVVKARQLQGEISANQLRGQVRSYYYQLIYLQYNKRKLQYLDTLYVDFVKAAALRFRAGESKMLELNTAETKRGEISLLLQQNEVYIANAYQSLKTLMAVDSDFLILTPAQFRPLQLSSVIDSAAIANHPAIRAFYQEAVIAEKNRKAERAQVMPDLRIGYNNQSLIGYQTIDNQNVYYGPEKRFISLNVGITIPLTFWASKGRAQAFRFQQQAAEENAVNQQALYTTELKNAAQQYEMDLKEYDYYEQQALPNAAEIVKAAQLGYRTGDIGYVEYLYSLQTSTDIELKYLQALQQVNQSVITINTLINN